MKKFSKLFFLCLSLAVLGLYSVQSIAGTTSGQRRTMRDMMDRRSGRSSAALPSAVHSSPAQRNAVRGQGEVVYNETVALPDTVSDKDGSLFPGGPCVNCHESGPLIAGGSCENCRNSGPLIAGGSCENCRNSGPLIDTGPCKTCKPKKKKCISCIQPKPKPRMLTVAIPYTPVVERPFVRNCCAMAPLTLEHVDFNLNQNYAATPYGSKLGNYRFRIFGCRRYDKEAILNRGRIMEKDMNFNKIFEEVTGDCYNLVDVPQDLCLQTTPSPLPEYVLTAEITDFFMNVCDQYDWNATQKSDARYGSAEMKVTWRLSNLSKTNVVWEGTTVGYSEIDQGAENGEIRLLEEAFADAASSLQMAYGFEEQLMVRLSPEELSAQRTALIDEEIALNPAKCNYQRELQYVKQCQVTRPEFNPMECPRAVAPQPTPCSVEIPCNQPTPCRIPAPCPVAAPEPEPVTIIDIPEAPVAPVEDSGIKTDYTMFDNCVDENGGVISRGQCMIVDDTWVDVKQDTVSVHDLCIVDRPPYEVLTPENLYKVRASVVEISNQAGQKGAGLIISDTFVLTSADLVNKEANAYKIRTINGKELSGQAVRVNPSKNIALIMLGENTEYTPLSLNLDLPKSGQGGYMVLGVLDVDNFRDGENYIDNDGKIVGIRYSEDKGSEIIADTAVQTVTIGGVLIDGHGTINGIAHTGKKTEGGNDLFLPTETALRSVGLTICEKLYEKSSPWQQTVYKPVTEMIMNSAPKAPEVLPKKDRK